MDFVRQVFVVSCHAQSVVSMRSVHAMKRGSRSPDAASCLDLCSFMPFHHARAFVPIASNDCTRHEQHEAHQRRADESADDNYAKVTSAPTMPMLITIQNGPERKSLERRARSLTRATRCCGIGLHAQPSGFHSGALPKHRPHCPSAPVVNQIPPTYMSTKHPANASISIPAG